MACFSGTQEQNNNQRAFIDALCAQHGLGSTSCGPWRWSWSVVYSESHARSGGEQKESVQQRLPPLHAVPCLALPEHPVLTRRRAHRSQAANLTVGDNPTDVDLKRSIYQLPLWWMVYLFFQCI